MFEDRFSALPDDLLVEILSRLATTKDTLVTSILSKRLRFVWTMVPILLYKEESDMKQDRLLRFIDKSLQHHKAPVLEEVNIKLGRSSCLGPVDVDVGKWIANAVDRKVRKLRLFITWSAEPARLCKSLYTCDTLVFLSLSEKVLVDVPSLVCLPSLKALWLHDVMYKDEDSLVRLLSNCPVLKVLSVRRDHSDYVKTFNIKNPSLEYLCYDCEGYGGSLVIDSLALKKILFVDHTAESCSILNRFCVDNAEIYFDCYPDDKFMISVSSVIQLALGLSVITAAWCNTINFSKLMECKICLIAEFDWLETLIGLLQNSPNLKLLFIDQSEIQFEEDFSLSWNEPSSVPKCLSSHLEIFQWNGYIGRNKEKELIRYIFTNSKCLKRAVISKEIKDEEKMKELECMFGISRSSQLLFSNQFEFTSVVDEINEYLKTV